MKLMTETQKISRKLIITGLSMILASKNVPGRSVLSTEMDSLIQVGLGSLKWRKVSSGNI